MSFIEKLQEIDSLQAAIQERGPIPVSLLNKINYKLRLEWNYTSNSMEGNSLTKRETRTVMVNNLEVNGKPIKDVMEIRSHDKVITTIMKMGKGELNISESRIKEIHKGIMYEEDAEKLKYVGQWKSTDNYMLNFDGERYDFTPHAEVPERMHELVNWINSEKEKIERSKKDAAHPALLAFKFQIDYLTIHPFYDGNGRTARILSNLILISYGFPPLYIKENEKQNYYRYLTDIQGGGGEPDLFYEFMAGLLLRSLQITIDTLDGKDVEETDDFVKEIQLLKAKAKSKGIPKSPKIIYDAFKIVESEIWRNVKATLKEFDDLFNETKTTISVNDKLVQLANSNQNWGVAEMLKAIDILQKSIKDEKRKIFDLDVYENNIETVTWEHKMFALNGAEIPTNFDFFLRVNFNAYKYKIRLTLADASKKTLIRSIYEIDKSYGNPFLPEELADISSNLKKQFIDEIKLRIDDSLE
ncbi:Fic family protein [Mucilaginibacter sp. AW1-7]|uniref:Fic family protein n=1 Tax=Mucilaginibacter sp. AW1-7 TaxID=3349874 RepID=UPI003F734CDA